MKFIDGTHLLITFSGYTVLAELFLESADGSSLVVRFDGLLGPYNRLMPLLWAGDGYREMIGGLYVGVLSVVEVTPDHARARVWKHRQISPVEVPPIADGETLSTKAD